eukprot:TRINITY_DN66403_c3_g4_i1.p1 TRINITY_DN66403_c3_g4~~TRINITY_DN66403_c3_g4_i1.p1  ORF type:complete len:457 (-),score=260.06 TRINITY_DN66403_c3_g4_i1:1489-2859(-)
MSEHHDKRLKLNNGAASDMTETKENEVLTSWVDVSADSHFPIQNLPWGVFVLDGKTHCGTAIGDYALSLTVLAEAGLFDAAQHLDGGKCFKGQQTLNAFMALGHAAWKETRDLLTQWLRKGGDGSVRDNTELRQKALVLRSKVQMVLPAQIGDYTDFYASKYHATNVGIMFRGKDNALQPNWVHLPVGYHGRSSSVVVSGTPVRRPWGQTVADKSNPDPKHTKCRLMDFELEMGCFIGGKGNALGEPIHIDKAHEYVFGLVLLNDWSARDIQGWEYVPLGPFTGKNLATTISPWIISALALEPFKAPREEQDPKPLPYLNDKDKTQYSIDLSVGVQGEGMAKPDIVATSNAQHLYWTFRQMIVHHSVTGCNMRPGDLIGSGTISGPKPGEFGSMLELSWKGAREVKMSDGTTRKFLKDNDIVYLNGVAKGDGYQIGFGECIGKVLPALDKPVAPEE